MYKSKIFLPAAAAAGSLVAWPAYAHGFGERTELPVPLGFFLIGAGLAVALSFVFISVLVKVGGEGTYWRFNLLGSGWSRAGLTSPVLLLPIKLLSVFLTGLVIATGYAGDPSPVLNFSPTFVWIIWWVGMAFTVALLGNIWALVNPWKILFGWAEGMYQAARPGRSLSLGLEYPRGWGIWPALILFILFIWIQDAYPKSDVPSQVATMTILYSVITLGGMAVFGRNQWLRHGEAFTVVFGLLSRFSPTEVRVANEAACLACSAECRDLDGECIDCYECFEMSGQRELNLRPYAIGLGRNELVTNDVLALVALMLATVTFDGFSATSAWAEFQTFVIDLFGTGGGDVFNSLTLADTLGVALVPVGFFLVYLIFSKLMASSVQGEVGAMELARVFAFSLIPIALAYNIAHFVTLLVVQGQLIIPLVSDPFGLGWDLFNTAEYTLDISVINARVLWFLSVALIVLGHVLAVYLAHRVAIRTFSDRAAAMNSQYPMLALMVVYTVISLWIIAQPIVQ
ncbi:MAG: hypothetical protein O3A93_09830 [Chloroflexi bacterium]|nr:hypothetical protein [Chloroflexota bacterium]MDA1271541.1 hypothetical protein [Chloroflexota bacterium]